MQRKIYHNGNIFLYGVVVIALVLVGLWFLGMSVEEEPVNGGKDTEWKTYRSDEFHFEIDYPATWEKAFFPDHALGPVINFYPGGLEEDLPLIHHSSVPQVSIFPHGIPTEGVFGVTATSSIAFGIPTRLMHDFITSDGDAWATFMAPQYAPPSWNESGFIWAEAPPHNLSIDCVRDGVTIDEEMCDPIFGDQIIRHGSVDEPLREIQVEMLESFRFTIGSSGMVADRIFVDSPQPDEIIQSPLVISGNARGMWYFEATFPVTLVDWDGLIIAEGYVTAEDTWMTEDLVPFKGELVFETPSYGDRGALILHRSNASGLPEHDASIEIPIRFKR